MIINILAIQLPSAFELLPTFELPPALAETFWLKPISIILYFAEWAKAQSY
jgi:hypothetical protein